MVAPCTCRTLHQLPRRSRMQMIRNPNSDGNGTKAAPTEKLEQPPPQARKVLRSGAHVAEFDKKELRLIMRLNEMGLSESHVMHVCPHLPSHTQVLVAQPWFNRRCCDPIGESVMLTNWLSLHLLPNTSEDRAASQCNSMNL